MISPLRNLRRWWQDNFLVNGGSYPLEVNGLICSRILRYSWVSVGIEKLILQSISYNDKMIKSLPIENSKYESVHINFNIQEDSTPFN